MKRLRVSRWSGQVLAARSGASSIPRRSLVARSTVRCQSSSYSSSSEAAVDHFADDSADHHSLHRPLPSPPTERASQSAKLAALHARLYLSSNLPLQTLARALVTPSADAAPRFNNASLAALGASLINYHVLEHIVCKWPRLPLRVLYEVLRAYAGPASLRRVAESWGVEAAAAPGEEVDPGLLQWSPDRPFITTLGGVVRAEDQRNNHYRRGVSSRVILDNAFGDKVATPTKDDTTHAALHDEAFASCVQAVVGSIYSHCGGESAKTFVTSHILSRQLDPSRMFEFKEPVRELSMLCAREGFEPPVARLESETGRLSRTPVFVVGIYSGKDKLGEGTGSSLVHARLKASMNALKAWYLYSPGGKVRVPSDMLEADAKPWTPPHIDIGEIV